MILTPDHIKRLVAWGIALVVPIVVVLPVYYFSSFGLSNICALLGVIFLSYVSLSLVARLGVFDVFRYQLGRLFDSFRKGMPKRYEDAYAYQKSKAELRKEHPLIWLPFTASGVILILLSILFVFNPM